MVISSRLRPVFVIVAFVAVVSGLHAGAPQPSAQSQSAFYSGSDVYKTYCAVCHGPSAKGDGPLAASLKKRPPDLTQFAKQNDGKYPADMVLKIIDGRQQVAGHGGPDMPV